MINGNSGVKSVGCNNRASEIRISAFPPLAYQSSWAGEIGIHGFVALYLRLPEFLVFFMGSIALFFIFKIVFNSFYIGLKRLGMRIIVSLGAVQLQYPFIKLDY